MRDERLRAGINHANGVRRSLASQGPQNNSTPQVRLLTDTNREGSNKQLEEPETAFLGPKNNNQVSTQTINTNKLLKQDKTGSYTGSVDENFEQKFTSHNSSKVDLKLEAAMKVMDQVKEESAEMSLLLENARNHQHKARNMQIEDDNSIQ